ncbi:MAG: hypothetical protein EXQ90_08540, partial [Rhodospirillales bacterium]|nr:hypothetical protein [Rhodospirillales bacterium]
MKFTKILFFMFACTAVEAVAQTASQPPVEKILTVETINGSKQSGVISYLSNATEPSILVAIIPGNPGLARATVTSTGKVE